MDCILAGMEQFLAGSLNQREYIKKMADMSEDYLLLAVGKYGFIDLKENTSYDELHAKIQEVFINILISLMMVSMTFVMLIIITLSVL